MATYTISVPDDRLSTLKQKLSMTRFPDEVITQPSHLSSTLRLLTSLPARQLRMGLRRPPRRHKASSPILGTLLRLASSRDQVKLMAKLSQTNQSRRLPRTRHPLPASRIQFFRCHPTTLHPRMARPLISKVTKMLPALSQSTNGVSFHVVAPSLPNFGWSEGVKQKGFGLKEYATVCHRLMQSLGYKTYVTQGGDWGYMISRTIGFTVSRSLFGESY